MSTHTKLGSMKSFLNAYMIGENNSMITTKLATIIFAKYLHVLMNIQS